MKHDIKERDANEQNDGNEFSFSSIPIVCFDVSNIEFNATAIQILTEADTQMATEESTELHGEASENT